MKYPNHNYPERGMATLEMLIAMALIVVAISATLPMVFGGQSASVSSQTNQEALYKAQQLLEDARATAQLDFNLVNPVTLPPNGIYQESLAVQQLDFYTKKVTGITNWEGENGQNLAVNLATLITNPLGIGSGETCNSVLAGDWTQPQITSYEFGKDLLSDPSSGFPIGDIDVNNQKLYAVVNNSNGNNLPTFFVFDISNQSQPPVFITSIDNNPNVKAGLNAIKIVGDYAYAASAHGANYNTCVQSRSCSQLHVIDLTSMTVVANLKIPGVTGSGGQAIGNSIFYLDGIVYLGLAKTGSGPEFNVIDVGGGGAGGSPTDPIRMGSLDIGNGVNHIFVKGNYAYVASPNNQELKVINVSSPGAPFQVGQFDAPGGGGNNGNGKGIYGVGTNIYFGRTLLNGDELYILNNTNPESDLPVLGSKNITDTSNNNTSVNGIIVRDYLTFLLTNSDFQIFKIDPSTNPYTIAPYATALPTPGGSGTTIDCEGNYIYFASLPLNDKGYIAIVQPGP